MHKCKCVKASLLSPYLQLSPSAAGTSRNGLMTSGTSGAHANTSELMQTLGTGVCIFTAQQAVCILPPKQIMAVWGELRVGAGTSLAQGIFRVVTLTATPLCHPQTTTEGRDIKPCVSGLRQCLVTAANRPGMDLGRLPNSSAFSKAGSALPVSLTCYPGNSQTVPLLQ